MKRLMLLTAAFAFSASMAMSAITASDLVTAYQAEGYTKIEVTTGLTQIKVEAVKGTTKVEVIYDAATGAILTQENKWAKRSERGQGVALATAMRDFLSGTDDDNDDDAGTDDGAGHDLNDDNGGDHSGSDDGAGHDAHDDDDDGDHSGHGKDGKGS